MQVAVAGMEDVADAKSRANRQVADAAEDLGQPGSRYDAVLHVIVRRNASHRGERRLPALPDAIALTLIASDLHRDGARVAADLFDGGKEFVDLNLRAVEFDDQDRLAIGKVRVH